MRVKHAGRAYVPSTELQRVIFDCDGVLVDSELITNRVFAQMLQEIGLPLTLDWLFEHFAGRSMQHCWHEIGKPAPDIFWYAAAKCGVEPARCAVIEDSPAGGRAGVTAGMRVYGYSAHTLAQRLRAAGAADTSTDMVRLPELLFGQDVSIGHQNRLD